MNSLADPRVVTDKTPRAIEHLGSRRLRARKGRAAGQTTVEFALICLPFFAILFAIIDYAQIYFYENSLQNAMREAARFATAGRIIQAYNSNGSPLYDTNQGVALPRAINDTVGREASRNECIRYWFQSNCVINIPISNIVIVSAPTLPGVNPTVSTNLANGDLSLLQANGPRASPSDQTTALYRWLREHVRNRASASAAPAPGTTSTPKVSGSLN